MSRDPNCVFCKIVAGELPSTKIAESPLAYAFMDVGPIARGHTLVIPRHHYETIMDMSAHETAAVFELAARVAPALKAAVGCDGLNVLQNNGRSAGEVVMHVHVHLIPRWAGDGLSWPWPSQKADPADLKLLAERITSNLPAI